MKDKKWIRTLRIIPKFDPHKKLKFLNPGMDIKDEINTADFSASERSSRIDDGERRSETSNIEEAESSLREGGCLNYEVGLSRMFLSLLSYIMQFENLY